MSYLARAKEDTGSLLHRSDPPCPFIAQVPTWVLSRPLSNTLPRPRLLQAKPSSISTLPTSRALCPSSRDLRARRLQLLYSIDT